MGKEINIVPTRITLAFCQSVVGYIPSGKQTAVGMNKSRKGEILLNLLAIFPRQLESDCFFCMVSMSILPGTVVKLPDGRNGTVVPSPWWTPRRVLVKMQHGKKRWCKVDECIPIRSNF